MQLLTKPREFRNCLISSFAARRIHNSVKKIDNYVMKLSCHCEVKEFQNLETVYLTFCKKSNVKSLSVQS